MRVRPKRSSISGRTLCWALATAALTLHPARSQSISNREGAPTLTFDADGYQSADGALLVYHAGDFVDVYFATKALLEAQSMGIDISRPAARWIDWALAHQDPDGRFGRYVRVERAPLGGGSTADAVWTRVSAADADDALLALWLQLLYRLAPAQGLPGRWRQSASLAWKDLDALRDPVSGLYMVSRQNKVALFMDNVEIYGALAVVAGRQAGLGLEQESRLTAARSRRLNLDIVKTFWHPAEGAFAVSTQSQPGRAFYPEAVAQIYPWLAGMPTPRADARGGFSNWLSRYGFDWLWMPHEHYPWGLVAVAAWKFDERNSASWWLAQAAHLRYSDHWTVLEEAIFQSLAAQLHWAPGTLPQPDMRLQVPPATGKQSGPPRAAGTAGRAQ